MFSRAAITFIWFCVFVFFYAYIFLLEHLSQADTESDDKKEWI